MRAVVLLCLLHAAFADWEAWDPFSWYEPDEIPPADPIADNACATDRFACGCCVMLQKTNRLRTHFNATLTELEKKYNETKESFNYIKDNRVAFSVSLYSLSEKVWKCYRPNDTYSVIVYKHAFLNQGGAYNVNNGIFTVPCSGVYILAVTVYSDAGAPQQTLAACASLQLNGTIVARAKDINKYDHQDSGNIVAALKLTVNDMVTVSLAKNCSLCDDMHHYNTFSAFLLYPLK